MEYRICTDEAKRAQGCFGVPQVQSVKPLSADATKLISSPRGRWETAAARLES